MFIILLFTVAGFLFGLTFVMVKRKIKPGKMLSATFAGLVSLGAWKIFKDYYKGKRRFYH